MALTSLSSIAGALAQVYDPKLAKQWNRSARTLSMLDIVAGGGPNVAWDIELANNSASSYVDGADMQSSDFATDNVSPAVLAWALYHKGFHLSEHSIETSVGSNGSPDALRDQIGNGLSNSLAELANLMNKDLFAGTGSGPGSSKTFVGLSALTASTGSYAGVAKDGYWGSIELANSGTPRVLSTTLLDQAEEQLYSKSNMRADFIVCHPTILRKYKSLFTSSQRFVGQPQSFDQSVDPDAVHFQGIPVIRDVACTPGSLYFINKSVLKVRYVAPVKTDDSVLFAVKMPMGSNGDSAQDSVGIPVKVQTMGKTGHSTKYVVSATAQLVCTRPNALAVIRDLDTTG